MPIVRRSSVQQVLWGLAGCPHSRENITIDVCKQLSQGALKVLSSYSQSHLFVAAPVHLSAFPINDRAPKKADRRSRGRCPRSPQGQEFGIPRASAHQSDGTHGPQGFGTAQQRLKASLSGRTKSNALGRMEDQEIEEASEPLQFTAQKVRNKGMDPEVSTGVVHSLIPY